ncbi:virulence RhuM family protein [Moraxella nasibovis]|uniref:virulence protein RhuM/Fic/DOC family protein n=1 Tax=Moraxella nasibovis TaxID=2904120 RepID=UPI00240ED8C4|nr:virulence protein RhuM/Fic/DOC family protein [Moraxella nasibovis]WFF38853.1 virulence RhuM family protein [Moraxella nasibovis]
MTNPIEIYQSPTGETEVEVRFDNETVWLSLQQMADIFGRDKSVISRHIKKVFDEEELDKNSTVAKNATVQIEGQREVVREIEYFNLDVIISVGYRVNSKAGTAFRRWATARLKDYLLKGYAINQKRLAENAFELEQALALIQKTAQSTALTLESGRGLIDIVSRYTQTFLWLQQYDEGLLSEPKGEIGGVLPTLDDARNSLATLKVDLIAKGEATELFAKERGDGLSAILGNLEQTVFGEPAYPSIEEKAAHLLYFVIKNHPFADGNKRSGAFLFVDFLYKNGRLLSKQGEPIINDTGLTALALLIAESNPDNKETLIKLVVHMLQLNER